MPLNLRIKSKTNTFNLRKLQPESTYRELCLAISDVTKLNPENLTLRIGFPPKVLENVKPNAILSAIPIQSGETLIVEALADKPPTEFTSTEKLQRQVIPADNSCLFTSVNFCITNSVDLGCSKEMRDSIAVVVSSDPATFSDSFLEQPNADYCDWIRRPDSWGGGIEVFILSRLYGVEIAVVDTQTVRVDRFGEDRHYATRILLIYNGIHYDALRRGKQTIFDTKNEMILDEARLLAQDAQARKEFTDLAGFTLRCMICQQCLRGQKEAQAHAQKTGHINFGEY